MFFLPFCFFLQTIICICALFFGFLHEREKFLARGRCACENRRHLGNRHLGAVGACDDAARLRDDQPPCGIVPRGDAVLKINAVTPRRHIGEVECRRAAPTDIERMLEQYPRAAKGNVRGVALVIRVGAEDGERLGKRTVGDEEASQAVKSAHRGSVGTVSAFPAHGKIQKIRIGVINHAAKGRLFPIYPDGNTTVAESADKVRRPVDRVDDKGQSVGQRVVFLLLGKKARVGERPAEGVEQELLHGDVVLRHKVRVPALLGDSLSDMIDGAEDFPRLEKDGECFIQDFLCVGVLKFFHGFLYFRAFSSPARISAIRRQAKPSP